MRFERCAVWLGAGALTAGLVVGMVAGAGVAAAEPESDSTSRSSEQSKTADAEQDSGPKRERLSDRRRARLDAMASKADRVSADDDRATEQPKRHRGVEKKPRSPKDDPAAGAADTATDDELEAPADPAATPDEPADTLTTRRDSAPGAARLRVVRTPAEDVAAAIDSVGTALAERVVVREQVVRPAERVVEPSVEPTHEPSVEPGVENVVAKGATLAALDIAPMVALAPAPARVRSPIEVIGTFVVNLVAAAGQALIPAPVIPAGSSVSMGRSTLEMPCGCGHNVDATWYFPDDPEERDFTASPAKGVVYLQHGFFRNDRAVSALAIQLAERTDSVVVTPTVTSNFFAGDGCWINGEPMQRAVADLFADRAALTASAQAAGWEGALPAQYILAGHSAGGGLAVAAASYAKNDEDLAGVILFDGVSLSDGMTRALEALEGTDIQVLQIAAPNAVWNSFGSSTADLVAARPGQFVGVIIVGGTHIDSEGDSSDLFARLLLGTPRAENVQAVQTIAAEWVTTLYGPDAVDGVTGPIGDATVIVLPAPRTPSSHREDVPRVVVTRAHQT